MPERTILVLGCGMAGVVAAREVRRLLPRDRVVVVDRMARASFPPSFNALAVGEVRGASIQRSRTRLSRKGIEFVNATVQSIDASAQQVRAEGRELRYDRLVLALGAETASDRVPGLAENTHSVQSYEGAERLASALRYFTGGRLLIAVSDGPQRWPPAPYELAMLLEHQFHRRKMRQKVEIAVLTPEAAPLAAHGGDLSELIAGQLAHKGIEFGGGRQVTSVDHSRRSVGLSDGSERPFDLLIAFPPLAAPAVVVEAGLVDESGWVTFDALTARTAFEGVYVAGDLARVHTRAGTRAPLSATMARQEAKLVAARIASSLDAESPPSAPLEGKGRWFIEVGAGAAAMVSGDFLDDPERLTVNQPSIAWHWAKTLSEKYWLYKWW